MVDEGLAPGDAALLERWLAQCGKMSQLYTIV
jgi:hypothetical protein